jgi:hypothetical protein
MIEAAEALIAASKSEIVEKSSKISRVGLTIRCQGSFVAAHGRSRDSRDR